MPSFAHPDHDAETGPARRPDLTHPTWCDSRTCQARHGDPHRGTPITVDADHIGSAQIQLCLWSPSDDPIQPVVLIELVASDTDSGHRIQVDLSVQQLERLHRMLVSIASQVTTRS